MVTPTVIGMHKEFYERSKISVYYSLLFGLSPVCVSRKNGKYRLITSKKLHIISCAYILIYSVTNFKWICDEFSTTLQTKNVVYRNLILVTNTGRILGMLMMYGTCFLNRDISKLALQELNNTDRLLSKLGIEFDSKKDTILQMLHLLFQPLNFLIITTLKIFSDSEQNFKFNVLGKIYVEFLFLLVDTQFILFVLTIKRYCTHTNYCLKNLEVVGKILQIQLKAIVQHFILDDSKNKFLLLKKIKLLMHLHMKLADIAKMVNKTYNFPLLALSTDDIGFMLINCFYAYDSVEIFNKNIKVK